MSHSLAAAPGHRRKWRGPGQGPGIGAPRPFLHAQRHLAMAWRRRQAMGYPRTPIRSEVGGLLRPGNLNGSCMRDPVAGLFIVISPPGPVPCPCPLGLVLDFVFRNQRKKLLCEMMELPWCFLHGF